MRWWERALMIDEPRGFERLMLEAESSSREINRLVAQIEERLRDRGDVGGRVVF